MTQAAKSAASSAKTKPLKAPSPRSAKASTKHDTLLKLLRQDKGATLDALVKSSGWQKHSVRGFLAGTVRKKLKLPLVSEKIDGVRTYRIGSAKTSKPAKKSARRAA
jgi:Protein of unknown function (DUF3489)